MHVESRERRMRTPESGEEAQAHPSRCASDAPPSTFPQKRESAGRARCFTSSRGLPRYEKKVAEARVRCNRIIAFWELFPSGRPSTRNPKGSEVPGKHRGCLRRLAPRLNCYYPVTIVFAITAPRVAAEYSPFCVKVRKRGTYVAAHGTCSNNWRSLDWIELRSGYPTQGFDSG